MTSSAGSVNSVIMCLAGLQTIPVQEYDCSFDILTENSPSNNPTSRVSAL